MRRMPIPRRNRFLWPQGHAAPRRYAVLVGISPGYPPAGGRSHTCYSPVRRSPAGEASFAPAAPRLACVKPVASVHPEPGSNSPLLFILRFSFSSFVRKANFSDKSVVISTVRNDREREQSDDCYFVAFTRSILRRRLSPHSFKSGWFRLS